jgi:putative transposase
MPDHVHMLMSIPPIYSVAEVILTERELRNFLAHKKARGYFVGTVRRNDEMIRAYIRNHGIADKELDQLQLKLASS